MFVFQPADNYRYGPLYDHKEEFCSAIRLTNTCVQYLNSGWTKMSIVGVTKDPETPPWCDE